MTNNSKIYTTFYPAKYSSLQKILSSEVFIPRLEFGMKELESLYTESKNVDADNLRLKTLFERLEAVSR